MAAYDYPKRQLMSYTRRVCSLYKKMRRDQEFWYNDDFFEARFQCLLIRAEFDKNKNIKDIRKGKAILEAAEKKFHDDIHPYHAKGQPLHPYSKEGIAYERELLSPDWVVDFWHPLEKARYPYYFAKREQMKDDYINMWKRKVLKTPAEAGPPVSSGETAPKS